MIRQAEPDRRYDWSAHEFREAMAQHNRDQAVAQLQAENERMAQRNRWLLVIGAFVFAFLAGATSWLR